MHDGARTDGGQEFLRVFSEQDQRGVLGWLFEDLEQAVGRLFHKGRGGEDGEGSLGLDGRTVVGHVNDLAYLAELDEQLRGVGRDNEQVGVSLDEDAGFFLVGFAQVVAGGHGRGYQLVQIGGVADAGAVAADAAKVRQAVCFGGVKAVDCLGEHQGQGVLARAAGAGQDERMGEPVGADSLAEVRDGGGVPEEVLEAHGMSLGHFAGSGFEDEDVLAVLRTGHVADCLVQSDQDAVFFRGQAEQKGVGDLPVAEDAIAEGRGEVSPACCDGPKPVAGETCQRRQHHGCFLHGQVTNPRIH